MTAAIFMRVLDMTRAAAIAIPAVLAARLLLKKAPRALCCALWAIVFIRLLCPASIELPISIMPKIPPLAKSLASADGQILSSGSALGSSPGALPFGAGGAQYAQPSAQGGWPITGQYIWLAGILAMAAYAAVSYIRLYRRLIGASPLRDNIYLADGIASPFVMGLFRPRIYLPSFISEGEQGYILLHEQLHIRRGDHIFKALAFIALCIHWFNPLVWVAFIFAGKDMEMSCDEAVIRKMGDGVLADYAASLLSLATGRHIIAGMPLAFGEGDTKGRIRNLVKRKKPAFWAILGAVIACAVLVICLMTGPKEATPGGGEPFGRSYHVSEICYQSSMFSFGYADAAAAPRYDITSDRQLIIIDGPADGATRPAGKFAPVKLSSLNFSDYFKDAGDYSSWHGAAGGPGRILSDMEQAWQLTADGDDSSTFYYLILMNNGDVYLSHGYDTGAAPAAEEGGSLIRWLFRLEANESKPLSAVQTWFDYLHGDEMPWGSMKEITLDEFPGVTFRWQPEKIEAITGSDIIPLYYGMPIWSVYFTDLTGDGLPELCSTISMGSGIIDERIIICDYAGGKTYTLEDRMKYDYTLFLQGGRLAATKRESSFGGDGGLVETGYPEISGGELRLTQ